MKRGRSDRKRVVAVAVAVGHAAAAGEVAVDVDQSIENSLH
jgi:hypothetical protein